MGGPNIRQRGTAAALLKMRSRPRLARTRRGGSRALPPRATHVPEGAAGTVGLLRTGHLGVPHNERVVLVVERGVLREPVHEQRAPGFVAVVFRNDSNPAEDSPRVRVDYEARPCGGVQDNIIGSLRPNAIG